MKKEEKLKHLKDIGAKTKEKEEIFRNQYNRIFVDSYDESRLLEILDKFTIEDAQTSIDGISNEFSKYVGHIPSENRDGYIGALLGKILIKVEEPPHKWEVTKSAFDEILQIQSTAIILFEQIRTIDKQRLREYLGTLDRRFIDSADKALAISIGLRKKD